MCGIVGYIGEKKATPILLDALEKLEYRGYDSAGIALVSGKGINIFKTRGRIADLRKIIDAAPADDSCVGIGHTRWATHGEPSDLNAHPHRSKSGRVAVVHNGIVENYLELRQFLIEHGHSFSTETDSEVVSELIDYCYNGDPVAAVRIAESKIKGSYSFGILFKDYPWQIIAMRKDSPLIIGAGRGENFIASDVPAILKHTRDVYRLGERELAILTKDGVTVINSYGERVNCVYEHIDWDASAAEKCGYPHFMIKEIMEQPEAIKATLAPRYVDGRISLEADGVPDDVLKNCERVCVVACGTAMHAGLVAQSLIRSILRMHMDVEYASEFMYMDPVIDDKTLVLAISQSGETIDTLEALKYARSQGAKSIAVINVKGSSIARESDYVMYTYAGPEIAVASTKAYTTQMAALFALIGRMAVVRGAFNEEQEKAFVDALMQAPDAIQQVLDRKEEMHHIARGLLEAKDAFMLGRGLDYAILLEGALKLKEVSYIHTEAYASGELKHGTIALITEKTPVVALVTQERVRDKELSNIREVQSRGASVVILVKDGIDLADADYTHVFTLPAMDDVAMAFPASAALQLLAYYVSMDRGLDVDKPRNLAKVVTVE